MKVEVKDTAGNVRGLDKKLDRKYYTLTEVSGGRAFIEGFTEFERDENASYDADQLEFPGSGIYTSFDISPGRFDGLQFTLKGIK
ncbi:MAG: hypothetical protein KA715_07735 [Xanthomonadaceae bacterium]|nr:hypothetical protein [Xanthomonadaceae bacterium]